MGQGAGSSGGRRKNLLLQRKPDGDVRPRRIDTSMRVRTVSALTFCLLPAISFGVASGTEQERKKMGLHVSSNAFSEGQAIPEKYTCDGQNVSPPLKWT